MGPGKVSDGITRGSVNGRANENQSFGRRRTLGNSLKDSRNRQGTGSDQTRISNTLLIPGNQFVYWSADSIGDCAGPEILHFGRSELGDLSAFPAIKDSYMAVRLAHQPGGERRDAIRTVWY